MKTRKSVLINLLIATAFLSLIVLAACDDTLTGSEIDSRIIPSQNVDYYEDIQPVFNIKCATVMCHDNQTMAGGLSLTSYDNTTADVLIVFPYQPESSKLVWAIEGQTGASPMPPAGYAPLTQNQIKGIKTWIAEGAKVKP